MAYSEYLGDGLYVIDTSDVKLTAEGKREFDEAVARAFSRESRIQNPTKDVSSGDNAIESLPRSENCNTPKP